MTLEFRDFFMEGGKRKEILDTQDPFTRRGEREELLDTPRVVVDK